MSEYRLFETDPFRRGLGLLGPAASKRIRATLERRVYPVLRLTPRQTPTAALLRDWEPPTRRIRIGPWRIFYEINDARRIVFLTAADHLKEAYQ